MCSTKISPSKHVCTSMPHTHYAWTHQHTHTCTCAFIHACLYACIHRCTCTHTHTHTHTHTQRIPVQHLEDIMLFIIPLFSMPYDNYPCTDMHTELSLPTYIHSVHTCTQNCHFPLTYTHANVLIHSLHTLLNKFRLSFLKMFHSQMDFTVHYCIVIVSVFSTMLFMVMRLS